MKKFLSIMLVIVMVMAMLVLTACNKNDDDKDDGKGSTTTTGADTTTTVKTRETAIEEAVNALKVHYNSFDVSDIFTDKVSEFATFYAGRLTNIRTASDIADVESKLEKAKTALTNKYNEINVDANKISVAVAAAKAQVQKYANDKIEDKTAWNATPEAQKTYADAVAAEIAKFTNDLKSMDALNAQVYNSKAAIDTAYNTAKDSASANADDVAAAKAKAKAEFDKYGDGLTGEGKYDTVGMLDNDKTELRNIYNTTLSLIVVGGNKSEFDNYITSLAANLKNYYNNHKDSRNDAIAAALSAYKAYVATLEKDNMYEAGKTEFEAEYLRGQAIFVSSNTALTSQAIINDKLAEAKIAINRIYLDNLKPIESWTPFS